MVTLRRATPDDAAACGQICSGAIHPPSTASMASRPIFPPPKCATGLLRMLLQHPGFYGVVAERDGRIIGSNFLDERSAIAGIGPITVDPAVQNQGVGRRLMQDVMNRADARSAPGVRLCQAAFHRRSLCLYTTMGFRTREPLSVMSGPLLDRAWRATCPRGRTGRSRGLQRVCVDVHGFDRGGELNDAIEQGRHGGRARRSDHRLRDSDRLLCPQCGQEQ